MTSWRSSTSRAQRNYVRDLAAALDYAGAGKPEILAAGLNATRQSSNLAHAQIKRGGRAPSRYSDYISRLDAGVLTDEVNRRLVKLAKRHLAAYPPKRRVFIAVDEHLEPYTPTQEGKPGTRMANAVATYTNNKKAPWSNPWLLVCMVYWHRGVVHRVILMARPIMMKRSKLDLVKMALASVRGMRLPRATWLFDMGYDANEVRMHLNAQKIDWVARFSTATNRHLILPGGKSVGLQYLVKEQVKKQLTPIRCASCERRGYICGRFTVPAIVGASHGVTMVEVHPRLELDRFRKWVPIKGGTFAVTYGGAVEEGTASSEFGWRWNIETWFFLLQTLDSHDMPKTMKSHVTTFLASVMKLAHVSAEFVGFLLQARRGGQPRHLQNVREFAVGMSDPG